MILVPGLQVICWSHMLRAVVDASELLSNLSAWVVFLQFHAAFVYNYSLTRMFQHLLALILPPQEHCRYSLKQRLGVGFLYHGWHSYSQRELEPKNCNAYSEGVLDYFNKIYVFILVSATGIDKLLECSNSSDIMLVWTAACAEVNWLFSRYSLNTRAPRESFHVIKIKEKDPF